MTDWAKLKHAYGPATDIPSLLEQLSPDPKADVWDELWGRICHQGSVYSASFPVLPYLADAAEEWPKAARIMPLALAAAIVIGGSAVDSPDEPKGAGFAVTIERLRRIAFDSFPAVGLAREDVIYLLQSTLALCGDTLWGENLDRLASGEFEGECPSCNSNLFLVIGEYGFFAAASAEWVNKPQVPLRPIEPAEPAALTSAGTARWLHDRAVDGGHPDLAFWICHVFGTATCPVCDSRFVVSEAIARTA
jgi:hypothetical protein